MTNKKTPQIASVLGAAITSAFLAGCSTTPSPPQKSKAYLVFQEKCKLSNPKVYKKIENVDGVLLLKIRPNVTNNESVTKDRYAPNAAMIAEPGQDSYIKSFLNREYEQGMAKFTSGARGLVHYIPPDMNPDSIRSKPGFKYVDYIDPATLIHYRYTVSTEIIGKRDTSLPGIKMAMAANKNFDLNIYEQVLHKDIITTSPPRYAITYEDHVIEDERRLGIASSTLKVIDTKTDEILGEYTVYARGGGFDQTNHNDSWLSAEGCPSPYMFRYARTRQFTTDVLIPSK